MSTVPTAYRAIIDPLVGVARDIVEQGERLVPVACVGNLTNGQTHHVLMSAVSEKAKGRFVDLLPVKDPDDPASGILH